MKSVVSFEKMVSLFLENDLSDDVWDMFHEMAVRDSTNYKIVIAKRNSDGIWELVK